MDNLSFFIQEGIKWVREQREKHRAVARRLEPKEWQALEPFFTPATLEQVTISYVPAIENPGFYKQLSQDLSQQLIYFPNMAGITFIDTIVIATSKIDITSEMWIPVLFHECVHVCQYLYLGLDSFMEHYVRGWAAAGIQYELIPLENDAYSLQGKFESAVQPFSVEDYVRLQLSARA